MNVLIRHLPIDASVVAVLEEKRPWSRDEQLLDEIRLRLDVLVGVKRPKPDPDRPRATVKVTKQREQAIHAARVRARERRRAIETGLIA